MSQKKISFKVHQVNTLTFQKNYYCTYTRAFNCLPTNLRQPSLSKGQFKCGIPKHYQNLVEEVYEIDIPPSFKTVYVKYHAC